MVQAWQGFEEQAWDGGYLVELTDGRRADIMIVVEDHNWEEKVEVTVDFYPAGTDYLSDVIAENHCVRMYGFTDQVQALNDFLEELRSDDDAGAAA